MHPTSGMKDRGPSITEGRQSRPLPTAPLPAAQIGLVSQEPTLFATTIFENIAMGREGATEAEVRAAAEAANALRFISHLPLQFQTQVRGGVGGWGPGQGVR